MYRTPGEREPRATPASEFVYEAVDDSAGRADGMLALLRYFTVPLMVVAPAMYIGGNLAGLAAFAGATAYAVRSWRHHKRRGGAVLGVNGQSLVVEILGPKSSIECIHLQDLSDIGLDVKTIQRVMDGRGMLAATRLIDSSVGLSVDTARIVLIERNGREIPLTTEYLPHMHATEWLGKIRVFVRKHGWLPEAER